MAQTVEEIYNGLIEEKQNQAALNDLMPQYNLAQPNPVNPFILFLSNINSSSKTAMWRLWLYIVAVAIRAQQVFFDEHVAEVKFIIANHKPGTLLWYKNQVLAFQLNYLLYWKDGKYQYLIDDPAAKIIKQCSTEKANGVRIRAAKSDGQGGLQKLSVSENVQVQAYLDRIRYADHDILFFSFDPDDIQLAFRFNYDALADLPALKNEAKAVIKNYLSFLGETEFGGEIILNGIIDKLQAVEAIINPVPLAFNARYGALPYTSYLAAGEYRSNAGYAIIDEVFFDNNSIWEADL